jgi:hypothetical protein
MRVSRGIAVLSVTAAAVLGLTACSSDAGTKADKPAAEASSPAEEVSEAESDFDLTAEDFVARVTTASQAAGTLTMQMTTTAAGTTTDATGVIRYVDGAGQEMTMVTTVPDVGDVEIRVVGGMVYMSMGELTGGKFIQVDPADTSNPLAASFQGMSGQLDPTGALSQMEGAVVSVEKAGEPEEVGGALAQPYTMVIDTAAASAAMSSELAGAASLPPQMSYTYWIDADDLMRRMSAELPSGSIDATFTGWGEPVDIVAPSADQITEMPF